MNNTLLEQSTRVALAAYLHDLGKFAERADIDEAKQQADSLGNTYKALNTQEYCPQFNQRYSHIHAAYTAIAIDTIEKHLPDLKTGDCSPFASWANPENFKTGDSLINAAARHHKPETFLQWIIASADRLASGFERSEFESYNRAEEETETQEGTSRQKVGYLRARQYTLFENIHLSSRPSAYQWRYPLLALTPASLFPAKANACVPPDDKTAREEYRQLWKGFMKALSRTDGSDAIPSSHKQNLSLWFDHFDSLWMTYTHAIPSATAGKVDGKFIDIPADVSLYDHSRTTAALAVALWRWHLNEQSTDEAAKARLQSGLEDRHQKLLLVQGDMAGIQDFIFASGGSSQKFGAKLLRGRSFMVSLLAECASLRILEALDLPPTSQVINAAGKFLIVAPNTPDTIAALEQARQNINSWFLAKSQGRAGLTLAWLPASAADFQHGDNKDSPFAALMSRLFALLDIQKLQRMDLCNSATPSIFTDYLARFSSGECALDEYSPAEVEYKGKMISTLAKDQISIGGKLANQDYSRLLVTREELNKETLATDFLGYRITFVSREEDSGKFGALARDGRLVRAWDYSLPQAADALLWQGYAKRFINAYVPVFDAFDGSLPEKYRHLDDDVDFDNQIGAIKPLDCIADEDRYWDQTDENQFWRGISALHTLKGDVDNLGSIFQKGLAKPTFAKMAALSRQMNAFFAIWLPWRCKKDFPNTYTVFAGGDDFFLIGPWKQQLKLAKTLREDFARYVTGNEDIHFSAGFYLSKPGLPIRRIGEEAETVLHHSKQHRDSSKNAVTCFGQTVAWPEFDSLQTIATELDAYKAFEGFSTGFIYGLLRLAEMAGEEKTRPESALWRSWLAYRVQRNIGDRLRRKQDEEDHDFMLRKKALVTDLLCKLAGDIQKYGKAYHIALHTHLYQYRD